MTTPAPAQSDGKTLGIVGLILAFIAAPIGLIVSAVARSQSKKAGVGNVPATIGLILGILGTIGVVIWIIVFVAAAATGGLTVTTY